MTPDMFRRRYKREPTLYESGQWIAFYGFLVGVCASGFVYSVCKLAGALS